MQYILTDLPRYVKITPKQSLANSVVAEGHVLLFSEDGKTLSAKSAQGTVTQVGGQNVVAGYVKRTNENMYFYTADQDGTLQPTSSRIVSSLYTVDTAAGVPQYPQAGGGGVEFYKCSELVPAVEGTPGGDTLTLHMVRTTDSSDTKDYTFTVEDASKTGDARTWISDNNMRLKKDNGVWVLQIASMSNTVYLSEGSYTNPWEVTMFMSSPDKAYKYNNTWTVSEGTEGTPATWSGYKATMSDEGGYVFADTATTGLSYADGLTPQVGTIYSQDAKVKVAQILEAGTAIPQDGLVFYMPFDGSTDAKVGTVAPVRSSYTGNITYETSAGIKYANVSNMLYKAELGDVITTAWTFIMYIKLGDGCNNGSIIAWQSNSGSSAQDWSHQDGRIAPGDFYPGTTKFHFYCMRVTVGVSSMTLTYDNGTKSKELGSAPKTLNSVYIGGNSAMPKFVGSIFDVAVYDRLLTDAEVEALYKRVIPLQV